MIKTKTLKAVVIVLSAVAIFAAGYFWRGIDNGMSSTAKTNDASMKGMENMAGMEGMSGMQGMTGMTSGAVTVSPEKQQLIGVRIATVERRPMVRTVRTVGTITYD